MSYETILYDVRDDGVATVTLNTPDNRNALAAGCSPTSPTRSRRPAETSASAASCWPPRTRRSSPPAARSISSRPTSRSSRSTSGRSGSPTCSGRSATGKPTLCAANGHVLAGALGLALCCDLILAKDTATFGTPEINVGVFPFMIMALIYRNVPRKKTNELLLLGERLSAEEAREAGIVNKVVRTEQFEAAVDEWATKLAAKSPVMMRLGKDAMYRQLDMPFEDALDYLRSQLTLAFATEDIQEGVKAFFEKREPNWSGR